MKRLGLVAFLFCMMCCAAPEQLPATLDGVLDKPRDSQPMVDASVPMTSEPEEKPIMEEEPSEVLVNSKNTPSLRSPLPAGINPIEFMRNTSEWPTLTGDGGGMVSFYEDGNTFYYVKSGDGRQYERYSWNEDFISLDRDTSWLADADGKTNAYDCLPYGSLHWARTYNWKEGSSICYSTRILGWRYGKVDGPLCDYLFRDKLDYNDYNTKTFIYEAQKNWGGDLGKVDSIGISYLNGSEIHWYARGYGWVSWEYNGPPRSHLKTLVWNKKKKDFTAPDLQCEQLTGNVPPKGLRRCK